MRSWFCAAACVAAVVSASPAQNTSNVNHPPVEAFGSLPTVSDPSLSPDGKHLALLQAYKGRPIATIWTLDPPGGKPVLVPSSEGFIDDVRWANNSRLLVRLNLNAKMLGDDVNPWHRTIAMDADRQNAVVLFSNQKNARDINYSASRIVDLAPSDPDHIYMPLYVSDIDGNVHQSLFRVDVTNGHAASVIRGNADTVDWLMDGSGNVVARIDRTKDPLVEHLLAYTASGDWKEIEKTDATGGKGLGIWGLTLDGKAYVQEVYGDHPDTQGLIAKSLAGGSAKELYFNPRYDITSALADPWTSRIIGVAMTEDRQEDIYFDPKLQALQKGLEAAFPGKTVHAETWDLEQRKVVVSVDGPATPPAYYVLDRQTHTADRLARAYPALEAADLGDVKPYPYKARDGLDIPAYLTLPPGKLPKNLPVVVLPHGGPMARDDMSFDWESQFLANRGYAVLRPNFRGSSGYGTKFLEAGYGQWGLKMQDDVTDGVKKLIADGIADPKRICIVGSSYGGYAALAGAAFTPELYACAASWAGVTDLRRFLSTRSQDYGRDSWMISSWTRFIGDRWDDSEKLDAVSPAENAAKIKAPVLLMHGTDDATVRIDQSERMDRALRRAGKKVTFVSVPKETHYMQAEATRVQWLTELEKFLKENIGN